MAEKFAMALVLSPVGGWVLMLLMGALHHSFWAEVPAVGYWPCVGVWAAITFLALLLSTAQETLEK